MGIFTGLLQYFPKNRSILVQKLWEENNCWNPFQPILWLKKKNPTAIKGSCKKNLLLMGGQLRPNPPSPLELNGSWNFGTFEKRLKKSSFFLNGPALNPPPLNGPAIKRRTFFCCFPKLGGEALIARPLRFFFAAFP